MIVNRNYSKIKGHLTIAIRNLELLVLDSKEKQRPITYINEYDYWILSLDLLRNCLYDAKQVYDGQIDVEYAVIELRSEITNFIKVVKRLEPWELAYLNKVWKHLQSAEDMLA